ncbi:MAG: HAD-IC family P-type ATPase [Aquificaceae bacterium]
MFRLNSNTINNEKVILDRLLKFAKLKEEEVLKKLDTDVEGLSPEEVQKRLEIYGPNQIVKEKAPPWYAFLLRAYMNPFTYILAFIALVSLIGDVLLAKPEDRDWSTVIIISAVLIVSGFMRFVQEYRSSRASEKLKSMIYITVAIKRKREGIKEIRSEEVVPGDIVHLSAGDIVPADIRIISSKDLFVDQSILTGESEPVEKYPNLRRELDKPSLYEMENICFMGTSVVSGSAVGVVLFTGEKTYMASIARELLGKKVKTEFEKGLDNTSRIFIKFMALMFPFVFLINGFTKGDWFDALMFALAVALGLTPELLPLIVVGNLAKGALVMAKKKTIVKGRP